MMNRYENIEELLPAVVLPRVGDLVRERQYEDGYAEAVRDQFEKLVTHAESFLKNQPAEFRSVIYRFIDHVQESRVSARRTDFVELGLGI